MPKWKHRAQALATVFVEWSCDGCVMGPPEREYGENGDVVDGWTCGKPKDEACIDYLCRCAELVVRQAVERETVSGNLNRTD